MHARNGSPAFHQPKPDTILKTPRFSLARLLATLLCAVTVATSHAEPVLLDRVVAVVNKSVITERELSSRVDTVLRNLAQQKVNPPPMDELRKQTLERLVTEKVLLDFGSDTGLRIDDALLDKTIERIAEQNKLTMAQFKATLERDGTSFTAFREDVRQDLLINKLREREVDSKVYVTDAEVDQFEAAQGNKVEQEYKLSHILVAIPEGATNEQIAAKQKKAETAARALLGGAKFAEVVTRYSEAPDALAGGDLGWRAAGRLPPSFLEALEQIKPGQATPIMRSPAGFHILFLTEKRVRDTSEVIQQTHPRHILIKVNELTSDSDAKARIAQVRDRILNGSQFPEQAKLYSEDGSASKGGDLDWVSPGDTVPEFEQAMNKLLPGQMSEPVRSPFGWHLIQVIERRSQDVTKDRERSRTRMELRSRKADEQYDDWIRQQRDRAYVELRLDDR